jgi:hypothetical protein
MRDVLGPQRGQQLQRTSTDVLDQQRGQQLQHCYDDKDSRLYHDERFCRVSMSTDAPHTAAPCHHDGKHHRSVRFDVVSELGEWCHWLDCVH